MRKQGVLLLGAWLTAAAAQAAPPALLSVKLAFPEDAIRAASNLVPVQVHTPPPLETPTRGPAAETDLNSHDWVRRTTDPYGSTPISQALLGESDSFAEPRHLLDPGGETEREAAGGGRTRDRETSPAVDRSWGWLAGSVMRMESTGRGGESQSKQSPWDALLDERDALDADETSLDLNSELRRPIDDLKIEKKSGGLLTDFGVVPRESLMAPDESKSTRIESDNGFPGFGTTDDER